MKHVEKKEGAIRDKIKDLLDSFELKNFEVLSKEIDQLYEAVDKDKRIKKINKNDLFDLLFYEFESNKHAEIFDTGKNFITDNIFQKLYSLPIDYEIKLEAPIFFSDFAVCVEDLVLPISKENTRSEIFENLEKYKSAPNVNYKNLCFKISGYLSLSENNETFKNILRRISYILQRRMWSKIYQIGNKKNTNKSDLDIILNNQKRKHIAHYHLKYSNSDNNQNKWSCCKNF